MKKHLSRAAFEIQRCLAYWRGPLPPQLAWRLSPEDWDEVVLQMNDIKKANEWDDLPTDMLHILGVRVFKDPTCPDMNLEAS